jgi:conjugal transfer pilus assembly protein TraD
MNIEEPVFIGKGFEWAPSHAQMAREFLGREKTVLKPPNWYRNLRERLGLASRRNVHGSAWIHGIGADMEKDVFMDAGDLYSHVGIIGTTGAGKGRVLEPLLLQALNRPNETVIIVDPKLDSGLRDRAYSEMVRQGRPEDFLYFSPAHPSQSVRLNPMQNYAAGAQLASRTTSTLPAASSGDNFHSFVWKSINNVVQGMIAAGEPPSLKAIRYLVEGNVEELFVRAFRRYMQEIEDRFPDWDRAAREKANNQPRGRKGGSSGLHNDYMSYYEDVTSKYKRSEPIEGLRSVLNHPQEHYAKMIVTIAPQLTALTTEDVGAMLSPDYDDPHDPRPIVNSKKIVNRGQVLYLALNSLGDNQTASWIGSLILSDIIAVAADRYNYEKGGDWGVTLIVDELAEVSNTQFIQAMNKTRGSKMRVIFATQVLSDLSVRFGDADYAKQILGNANTMFFLRSKDSDTKEFISEKMATTRISSVQTMHSGSTKTDTMTDFSRSLGTKFQETDGEARVPPELFDELPDLHFFATLHDGRKLKLRMPFSQTEPEFRYPEIPYGDL